MQCLQLQGYCGMIMRVVRAVERKIETDRHDPEPVQGVTKIYTAYRSVKSDFYILSISKYGKQKILNLELSLCCLDCN